MTMDVYHEGGFNLPVATLRTRRPRRTLSWMSALCFGIAIGVFGTAMALTNPTPALRCATFSVAEVTP